MIVADEAGNNSDSSSEEEHCADEGPSVGLPMDQ